MGFLAMDREKRHGSFTYIGVESATVRIHCPSRLVRDGFEHLLTLRRFSFLPARLGRETLDLVASLHNM